MSVGNITFGVMKENSSKINQIRIQAISAFISEGEKKKKLLFHAHEKQVPMDNVNYKISMAVMVVRQKFDYTKSVKLSMQKSTHHVNFEN